MPLFYDTHAHLDFPDFTRDLADVVARAQEAGVERIICVGTDLESSRRAIQLSGEFPQVYAAAGWHPTHVLEAPEDIRPALVELARHPRVVAIGETGLDFYRMPSRQPGGTAEDDAHYQQRQRDLFTQQLEVAVEVGLNVIVHQRGEVLASTLEILGPFAGRVRGVFHCFGGDTETLQRILELDSLVSYTGVVTFKNAQAVRDTLAATPMDQFMLETDSPFLAPVPHRGKRCEPAYVRDIAQVVAQARGCSLEALSQATCATAHRFFPKLGAQP